jgi:hypothetical protein
MIQRIPFATLIVVSEVGDEFAGMTIAELHSRFMGQIYLGTSAATVRSARLKPDVGIDEVRCYSRTSIIGVGFSRERSDPGDTGLNASPLG